jgi:hypothetical protein
MPVRAFLRLMQARECRPPEVEAIQCRLAAAETQRHRVAAEARVREMRKPPQARAALYSIDRQRPGYTTWEGDEEQLSKL